MGLYAGLELEHPGMLTLSLLALAPILAWIKARRVFAALSSRLPPLSPRPRPPVLLVLIILLASLAASSPRIIYSKEVSIEDASVRDLDKLPVSLVLCIDVSKSMGYRDGAATRMSLAKSFVERLAREAGNIELVVLAFSGTTSLVYRGPPGNISDTLSRLAASGRYSAIGDALGAAASYVRASGLPGAAIVVTDGGWNYGADPVEVAEELRAEKIPVAFIIVGDDPRGTRLIARLEEKGFKVYRLDESTSKVIDSLVAEAARSIRLDALRLAGINKISLPIGERDFSWIPGLLAAILLATRLLLD